LVTLEARVSAREWPPRADLTTPAHIRATKKCDDLNAGYGQEPSGGRFIGEASNDVHGVTLVGGRIAVESVPSCTLRHEDHR
jgi:hypothetical protein